MNHSLPPLKSLTVAIHLAVIGGSLFPANVMAEDEEWIINHPYLFTNLENQTLAETFVDTTAINDNGYPPLTGAEDERPLIILYNPDQIDTVTENSGDQLILRSNIFTFSNKPAIHVDDELDGIVNDNQTIWSFDDQTLVTDPDKAAIYIEAERTKVTTTTTTTTVTEVAEYDGSGNPVLSGGEPVVTVTTTPVTSSIVTYVSGVVTEGDIDDPVDDITVNVVGDAASDTEVTTTTVTVSVDSTTNTTSGKLTGSITNTGNIKGGIFIEGQAVPTSGAVYESYGDSSTTGKATLKGGITVMDGGLAESVVGHAVDIKNHSYIDYVVTETNGVLKAKGTDSHAVFVAEGGELGADTTFTHGIDTLQSIGYIPITGTNDNGTPGDNNDDFDNAVVNVDEDGYRRVGDEDDLEGNDTADLYLNVDLYDADETSNPDDGDLANGADDSDDDGNPDLYKVIEQQLPDDISGTVTRAETDTVIYVQGTIESEQANAVRVEGTATGKILVAAGGQLKGALDVAAGHSANYHKAAVAIGKLNDGAGTYNGTIANQGTIDGGVFVAGTHDSAGSLYHSLGTASTRAKMNGGYHVINGGAATAATGNAIHLDYYSETDDVAITGVDSNLGEGGSLTSTAGHGIYIEQTASLGGTFYSQSFTDAVVTVKDDGSLVATDAAKEAIVVKGNLYGYVHADNGTITGGIRVDSTGVMGGLGTLASDDYALRLENGSTLDGNSKHALSVDGVLKGKVEIADAGSQLKTDTGGQSAIYVSANGRLGASAYTTDAAVVVRDSGEISTVGGGGAAILSAGYFNGGIEVNDGKITAGSTAVDFTNSDTPLLFKQTGSASVTTGSIIGSTTHTNDKVELLDGSLTGGTLTNIDELLISTNADVGLNANFTFPAKTTIQIEEGFAAAPDTIMTTTAGTVFANADSQLTFKPASLQAYQELVADPLEVTVISGTIDGGTDDNLTTAIEGISTSWVSSASALLSVSDATIDGTALKVTLQATNPAQYIYALVGDSLDDTTNTSAPSSATQLMTQAVSALSSAQSGDQARVEALFNSLNSTTDFNQLAAQLAQPTEITGRAGLGAMNTTQGITLSEARGQINGFSYGDSFDLGELWGQVIYSKSDQATVSGIAGYKGKTNGYILGAGLSMTDDWLFGLSGAMTTTAINGEQGADLKVTSYISSLYSHWDNDHWFFDSLLTLGLSKNDTQKTISLQRVEADYDSILWGGRLLAGRHFNLGYWQLSPQLEFNYGHVSFEKYTERGNSGWEKEVKASDYEIMELGGGFRANHSYFLGDGSIRPELSVMGYYDIKNQGSQFEATYLAGGDPFVVTEAERDRFRIQSALGVSVDLLDSWTLNAAYNMNWSDHYKAHSFSAKARYEF